MVKSECTNHTIGPSAALTETRVGQPACGRPVLARAGGHGEWHDQGKESGGKAEVTQMSSSRLWMEVS